MNQPPPNSPTQIERIPSQFNIDIPPRLVSNSDSVPTNLRGWYSTKVFRTVMFFIFCFCILGVSTSLVFTDRMNIENYMNVISSLLFLLSPSPLDLIKNKKK